MLETLKRVSLRPGGRKSEVQEKATQPQTETQEAVVKQHGAVQDDGHMEKDSIDWDDPPTGTDYDKRTALWRKILKVMKAQDESQVASWKSDMDNLLIFAALYSAVVTAFLIESFKLVTEADKPEDIRPFAIRVNKIWFVSLTLSILAALFAIAVQQWLRHLQIPKHIPLREAIRLRQLRHQGIVRYQVPIIVSILPALVQISVVLFLIGLLQYVRPAGKGADVSAPFLVVASIALVAFVIVSLIPIVDPSCPYKSPFVHIIWQLGWLVMVVVTLFLTTIITFFLDLLAPSRLSHFANMVEQLPQRYLPSLQPSTNIFSRLWTERELKRAGRDSRMQSILDQQALAWAMTAGPTAVQLKRGLEDLPSNYRITCVLEWIAARFFGQADAGRLLSEGTLRGKAVARINEPFADEYALVLYDVIDTFWTSEDKADVGLRKTDDDVPHAVTLLWAIVAGAKFTPVPQDTTTDKKTLDALDTPAFFEPKTREEFHVAVFKTLTLVHLGWGGDVLEARRWNGWKAVRRVPSVLLFDLMRRQDAREKTLLRDSKASLLHDSTNTLGCLKVAHDLVVTITDAHQAARALLWAAPQEHIFSASAIALLFLLENTESLQSENGDAIRNTLQHLLAKLNEFIVQGHAPIHEVLYEWTKLKDTQSLPFVSRVALGSICRSIEQLRRQKILHASDSCASFTLVGTLDKMFNSYESASNTSTVTAINMEMVEAKQALRDIGDLEADEKKTSPGTSTLARTKPLRTETGLTMVDDHVMEELPKHGTNDIDEVEED